MHAIWRAVQLLSVTALIVLPQQASALSFEPVSPVATVQCATAQVPPGLSLGAEEAGCLGAIFEFGLAMGASITATIAAGAATAACAATPVVATCLLAAYAIAQAEQSMEALVSAGRRMEDECLATEEFLASLSPRVVALAQH